MRAMSAALLLVLVLVLVPAVAPQWARSVRTSTSRHLYRARPGNILREHRHWPGRGVRPCSNGASPDVVLSDGDESVHVCDVSSSRSTGVGYGWRWAASGWLCVIVALLRGHSWR